MTDKERTIEFFRSLGCPKMILRAANSAEGFLEHVEQGVACRVSVRKVW
jgi:hypothetical protein